ncbi:hypothetical protein SAMN04515620_12411 [Collimonas sp. OK607]|nr:hypothetical protein SAMN04515620_12411 [Collimonas sp. OK607]
MGSDNRRYTTALLFFAADLLVRHSDIGQLEQSISLTPGYAGSAVACAAEDADADLAWAERAER